MRRCAGFQCPPADGPARHGGGNRRLALYLASDEGAFATGQSHIVDGGFALSGEEPNN